MMKKVLIVSLVLACFLVVSPGISGAGTFMVGGKYWHAEWQSAVLDWFEKDIGAGLKEQGLDLESDIDPGTGYLAGPLLGYQTDDGTWAISLAAMVFSDFSQDWTGNAGSMVLDTNVDTERMDFDFAVIYALSKFQDTWSLFKYTRVFAGYKYQIVDYDLGLGYQTFMGDRHFKYKLDADVHMPTLGIGFVYPVFQKLVLGLQAGVGLALTELEMTDPDGNKFDISPDASLTYNGEFTITWLPIEHLMIQAGLRGQIWYLKARSPAWWEETESEDITWGPTISAVLA
ncbi:MAG: hypothetical protein JRJ47_13715, partial [Deltaproteobacteria bacterium]|nr:hypothetical protein [Deltaproteobacteria bacterium]